MDNSQAYIVHHAHLLFFVNYNRVNIGAVASRLLNNTRTDLRRLQGMRIRPPRHILGLCNTRLGRNPSFIPVSRMTYMCRSLPEVRLVYLFCG